MVDLAIGHVKALKKIEEKAGLKIYNLGTGVGYSVLDIVKNFEEATGVKIPYVIKARRPGDIATCYADASLAKKELGWEAQYGIKEMCADSWRWQKNNPNGYEDSHRAVPSRIEQYHLDSVKERKRPFAESRCAAFAAWQ